jgi:transcriptional regulator with XRE-family HTH domain
MTGERLQALRKAAKMSQAELADAIGMSRETIGQMERGQAPIERRTELAVLHVCEDHRRVSDLVQLIRVAATLAKQARAQAQVLRFDATDIGIAADLLEARADEMEEAGQ